MLLSDCLNPKLSRPPVPSYGCYTVLIDNRWSGKGFSALSLNLASTMLKCPLQHRQRATDSGWNGQLVEVIDYLEGLLLRRTKESCCSVEAIGINCVYSQYTLTQWIKGLFQPIQSKGCLKHWKEYPGQFDEFYFVVGVALSGFNDMIKKTWLEYLAPPFKIWTHLNS